MSPDPSDLSPDEYLRRLNEQAAGTPSLPDHSATAKPVSEFELKPGQTLRQALTAEELVGLRAFSLRMGMSAEEAEASFDEPYDPTEVSKLEDLSYGGYTGGIERESYPTGPATRHSGKIWLLGLLFALVIVVGVTIFAVLTTDSSDSNGDSITKIEDAKGAAHDRGSEAINLVQKLEPPETWKNADEPELSISGDGGDAYAFYRKYFTASSDYTAVQAREWFTSLALVKENAEESSCEDELGNGALTCEVDVYKYGVDGYPDYDSPRQTLTFSYYPARPASGDPDVLLTLESYSTS